MKTLIIILVIALIIGIVNLYIYFNNKLYCKYYLREEWKLWERILLNINNVKFIGHSSYPGYPDLETYTFNLTLDGVTYMLVYWVNSGKSSVHLNDECILSSFDQYHSEIVSNLLREKVS